MSPNDSVVQTLSKNEYSKAGHYEVHGETIAKYEFFENGFNPYSRYLDVDKIDFILRRKEKSEIKYYEVQVKYGRLYRCKPAWERKIFDVTSWRFFKLNEFKNADQNLFLAYVLAEPEGYKGDIFIFPITYFHQLIQSAVRNNTKKGPQAKFCIAHCITNGRWYLWKRRNFTELSDENVVDVTEYRRGFSKIKSGS